MQDMRSLVNAKLEHDCWAEPHGTVNRDFTRVLFTTNWGRSGAGQVETMLRFAGKLARPDAVSRDKAGLISA